MSENESTFEWPDENDRETTYLDGQMPGGDNYTRLAWAMECKPSEVSRLIQQHAPWNGKTVCDDALRERAAIVAWLRECAQGHDGLGSRGTGNLLRTLSGAVERGEHRTQEEP